LIKVTEQNSGKNKDHDIDLADIRNPKKPPIKLPMAS